MVELHKLAYIIDSLAEDSIKVTTQPLKNIYYLKCLTWCYVCVYVFLVTNRCQNYTHDYIEESQVTFNVNLGVVLAPICYEENMNTNTAPCHTL